LTEIADPRKLTRHPGVAINPDNHLNPINIGSNEPGKFIAEQFELPLAEGISHDAPQASAQDTSHMSDFRILRPGTGFKPTVKSVFATSISNPASL